MCTDKIGVCSCIIQYELGVYKMCIQDECYTYVILVTQQCVYWEECACMCHAQQCVYGMSVYKMCQCMPVQYIQYAVWEQSF